jgi:3-deoxy-D-manno-octulosonic-acid transferase
MKLQQKTSPLKDLQFSTKTFYVIEQIIAHMLIPLIILLLIFRSRKEPAHLKNLKHRIGFGPVGQKGAIWVYAASLGETRAASPLIYRLRSEGFKVLLTHQSPAGLAEGARIFGLDNGVTQCYVPLDFFWAVRIFLQRSKPLALVVMEIEIWPAMLIETARKGVLVTMANGNLLDRSTDKKDYLRRRLNNLYQIFNHIFTRTDEYRSRYLSIGVKPENVSVVGELKFDQLIDPAQLNLSKKLHSKLIGAQRILMIASSVRAEERLLLPMVVRLISADPGLRVVWVPRSPQRFRAVEDALTAKGVTVQKRSSMGSLIDGTPTNAQVLLGDSIGEMNVYYPLADLVFVGASLVDHGGHNVVEPMALGKPIVMGPSIYGVAFAASPAAIDGALEILPDAKALETRITALMLNSGSLAQMSAAATNFINNKAGAADKTCVGIKALLTLSLKDHF